MKKLVFGKGINDSKVPVTFWGEDGKRKTCPYYERWTDMLRRCYCEKQLARMPAYKNSQVCDEWLVFSNFKNWMESQSWEGKVLDKDFLYDSKVYSPSTCVFIPEYVNFALMGSTSYRGVTYHKRDKVYQASIRKFGKGFYLGSFSTEEAAKEAYRKAKKVYLEEVIDMYTEGVYDVRIVDRLKEEIKRNDQDFPEVCKSNR